MFNVDSHGCIEGKHKLFLTVDLWGDMAFVHVMAYRRPGSRDSYYQVGYISVPRSYVSKVDSELLTSLGVSFQAVFAPWLAIPNSYRELIELVDTSYWVGIDYIGFSMETQPEPEYIRDQLIQIRNVIINRAADCK